MTSAPATWHLSACQAPIREGPSLTHRPPSTPPMSPGSACGAPSSLLPRRPGTPQAPEPWARGAPACPSARLGPSSFPRPRTAGGASPGPRAQPSPAYVASARLACARAACARLAPPPRGSGGPASPGGTRSRSPGAVGGPGPGVLSPPSGRGPARDGHARDQAQPGASGALENPGTSGASGVSGVRCRAQSGASSGEASENAQGTTAGSFGRSGPKPGAFEVVFSCALALLACSGFVSTWVFVGTSACLCYSLALARFVVPQKPELASFGVPLKEQRRGLNSGALFRAYKLVFSALGLLAPSALALTAVASGNQVTATLACSYLFSLLTQILSEKYLIDREWASFPGFTLLAALFTALRILQTWRWVAAVSMSSTTDTAWLSAAEKILVPVLLLIWTFNLFGFLLPLALPYSFKVYLLGLQTGEQ